MADGSIATVPYNADGGRAIRKERIEMLRGGRSAVIDDFIEAQLCDEWRSQRDKGKHAMPGLQSSTPWVPLAELLAVSEATLAVIDSLATGEEVELSGIGEPEAQRTT